LYERLSADSFQQLCGALIAAEYPRNQVRVLPIGHSDGGRDVVRRSGADLVIYQVKWSRAAISSPLAWLESVIKKESEKIRTLVAAGATEYIIVTSLHGTAVPGRGLIDRFDAILEQRSKEFGIPMSCWWRADIDARVDAAHRELKWSYSEMLSGNDSIRYLIEADRDASSETSLNQVIMRFVATQASEDAKVKFKRVQMDRHTLGDLYIDVEATRTRSSRGSWPVLSPSPPRIDEPLGSAARYLLSTPKALTLVKGEPGQGKSTLGQFISQVHRFALLPDPQLRISFAAPADVRVPIRIDLRDYAAWLAGEDPANNHQSEKRKPPKSDAQSLEHYMAYLFNAKAPGSSCSVTTINDILTRFPTLVILDGLDEVAQSGVRSGIVAEIDVFSSRFRSLSQSAQIVVTTRPNASNLREPSDEFETIVLARLSESLKVKYLRRWADANEVRGTDRRTLERVFRERTAEPHIALLADNPMQLTILLHLIHKRGPSVPSGRTALYTAYMETLFDREGEKTQEVIDYREDLEEVTAFLGWHLQSLAESNSASGRVPTRALKKAILDYLFDVEKPTDMVEALFTTVTDKVWALTSKLENTFEFDVQPLREYFAARYLHDFAGAESSSFDAGELLRELIRRPYWLNTCRFYLGFATANELAGLVGGIAEEFESVEYAVQVRATTWALLADGVFYGMVRSQKRVIELLTDDLTLALLPAVGDRAPLGGTARAHLINVLQASIVTAPENALASARMELLSTLLEHREVADWWRQNFLAGQASEHRGAWIRLARVGGLGVSLDGEHVEKVDFDPAELESLLSAGVVPNAGGDLEGRLLRAALAGTLSDVDLTNARGYVADILRTVGPDVMLAKVVDSSNSTAIAGRQVIDRRSDAFTRLKKRDPKFSALQTALRIRAGESGPNFVWSRTAEQVVELFGPCWLASEIAITGASLSLSGSSTVKGAVPLGPEMHYGALITELRMNADKEQWWSDAFEIYVDSLSRRTWTLALLAVASERVVRSQMPKLHEVVRTLSDQEMAGLLASSSRIGAAGAARRLSRSVATLGETPTMRLLLSHHAALIGQLDHLPHVESSEMEQWSDSPAVAWPYVRALIARAEPDGEEALRALRRFGRNAPLGPVNLSALLASQLIEHPGQYPAELVREAAKTLARTDLLPPLVTVSDSAGWFVRD
jgi:hypothetical protein